MENLAKEISEVIVSSRITNVTDSMDEVVEILASDDKLLDEVENLLTKDDVIWVNKNNNKIFFEVSFENDYPRSINAKVLDMDVEIQWLMDQLTENEINWENIKFRYKKAIKNLDFKNVTYYQKIREVLKEEYPKEWRYINSN